MRRKFNRAFFKHIYIDDDYNVTGELDQPFATLLGDDLRRAAAAAADDDLREAVENALKERTLRTQATTSAKWSPQPQPRPVQTARVGVRTKWWARLITERRHSPSLLDRITVPASAMPQIAALRHAICLRQRA